MKDKRVIVQLAGGLGNQMFQYAAGRALAARHGGEVVLDTWSGFARDKVYRRSYELGAFPIKAREAKFLERVPFWVDRAISSASRRLRTSESSSHPTSRPNRVTEVSQSFSPVLFEDHVTLPVWVTGYWQSPRYFEDVKNDIASELAPPEPAGAAIQRLGAEMRATQSVAVGIRLYEESPDPTAQSHDRTLKTPADVNRALKAVAGCVGNARFYVFCTHRANFLKDLNLPAETRFVTAEDGFRNAIDTLWLLSQCHHHVFTNSSFYWWGAWLSEQQPRASEPLIYAANNFANVDTLPDHWQRF